MLTLPHKFLREAEKAKNHPFALLQIDSRGQSAEVTDEADWAANVSESNVDYTPTPPASGDVILAQTGTSTGVVIRPTSDGDRSPTGALDFWATTEPTYYEAVDEETADDDTTYIQTLAYSGDAYIYFGSAITLDPNALIEKVRLTIRAKEGGTLPSQTEYARLVINGTTYENSTSNALTTSYVTHDYDWAVNPATSASWTSADLSTIGQWGPRYDRVTGYPVITQVYLTVFYFPFQTSGNITVQLDLGASAVTANNATITIDDQTPTGTGLTYTLEGSATGAWAGEEVSLGAVSDGSSVPGYRYYQPTANFTSDGTATSVLKSIRIEIPDNIYKFSTLSDNTLDALPLVQSIPSRTIEVDLKSFLTKTSNITINLVRNDFVDEMVRGNYFRGLVVNMKLGMLTNGITKEDLIPYYQGRIADYKLTPSTLSIEVQDASKDLSQKWPVGTAPSTKPSQAYSAATHMADVIDGIIDDIGILTRYVDRGSLASVKANVGDGDPASDNYVVFRGVDGATDTTITEAKPAKDYITELLHLLGAFMVIPENGKMTFVLYSSATAAEETWDDLVFGSDISFAAGLKSLKNVTDLYYDNTGDGDELKNFASVYITVDADSPTNWDITAMQRIKSLWLAGDATTGFYGDELAAEITARETARMKDGLGLFTCKTSLVKAGFQVGDFIDIDSDTIIKPDIGRGSTQKFIIVKKTWNPESNAISWVGMEAR